LNDARREAGQQHQKARERGVSMFDLIIENAEILDGSGKESYKGDIGIRAR